MFHPWWIKVETAETVKKKLLIRKQFGEKSPQITFSVSVHFRNASKRCYGLEVKFTKTEMCKCDQKCCTLVKFFS